MDQVDLIWKNGELVPWEQAQTHVLSHGLHYGTGVFEGIRCYETAQGPAVFRNRDHLKRLEQSAELYYMPLPYTPEELRLGMHELLSANELKSCYIRPLAYRGYGEMGLYAKGAPIDVIIAAWPWGAYLGAILAKTESANSGYDEAILLDERGFVCEGSGENIFVIREGEILTPP